MKHLKLQICNLKKDYGMGTAKNCVLKKLNLEVEEGEFVAIIGDSGCGKTTLLNIIGGLVKATSGKVLIENVDIASLKGREQVLFRRKHLGYIFQHYNLINYLTVYENIVFNIKLDKEPVDEELFQSIVTDLQLTDKLNSYPDSLSGGQKQRTAIARALLKKPDIILADEPTGSLDSKNSNEVFRILREMSEVYSQTVVFVTHNQELAKRCDRILYMKDGELI